MQRTKQRPWIKPRLPSQRGEPTWEVAQLFPNQGDWSEEEYFDLTEDTNWMVVFTDGKLEVLHLPEDAPRSRLGQPTWEVAYLFPVQACWSESDYLALQTNRLVELSDGCLEVLPMPLPLHQVIAFYLARMLAAYVEARGLGTVLPAPLQVRLWKGKIREPDVAYVRKARLKSLKQMPRGVDLAMEVVSEGREARERDYRTKRREYARARVSEYWIIDVDNLKIRVLKLVRRSYKLHGEFGPGETATSALLPDFSVSVDQVFASTDDA